MHLITRLTSLTVLALALTACAGNSPRRPAGAESDASNKSFLDQCADQQARGIPPTAGCPAAEQQRPGQRQRTLPDGRPELFPEDPLSNLGLPQQGGLLKR